MRLPKETLPLVLLCVSVCVLCMHVFFFPCIKALVECKLIIKSRLWDMKSCTLWFFVDKTNYCLNNHYTK